MIAAIVEVGASTTMETCIQAVKRETTNKQEAPYQRAQRRQKTTLALLEFLPRLRLEMERGLASLLVGGSFDLDFVICHNLFHDFTECSGSAISACRRKVDRRQGE